MQNLTIEVDKADSLHIIDVLEASILKAAILTQQEIDKSLERTTISRQGPGTTLNPSYPEQPDPYCYTEHVLIKHYYGILEGNGMWTSSRPFREQSIAQLVAKFDSLNFENGHVYSQPCTSSLQQMMIDPCEVVREIAKKVITPSDFNLPRSFFTNRE